MRAVIQRVSQATVYVGKRRVGDIGHGIALLLGIEQGDTEAHAQALLNKVIKLRIFSDDQGRMNRSLRDVQGDLLVVSQFTLAADTSKGNRPGFSHAAEPREARTLYQFFLEYAQNQSLASVASGEFGADMAVHLINDGPVTFVIDER